MSVKIRLARGGAKKKPSYRIVVATSSAPRDGRFIEKIGTYSPLLNKGDENRVRVDHDKAKYWLSVGAEPSPRVSKFFSQLGLLEKRKIN